MKFIGDRLQLLARHVDLDDPEKVTGFIVSKQCAESYKDTLVKAYLHYARFYNLSFIKPRFRFERCLPKIPTRENIMKVVSASSLKYASIFKVLMETGVMPYELSKVRVSDIDLERGVITVRGFKGHSSRAFKLTSETLAMLKQYLSKYYAEYPFPDSIWIRKMWIKNRNKVVNRLKDSSIKAIRLYDLRHYYATMLYNRTKDILLVKEQLGHKKIETTLIYTRLVNFSEDEYYSAVAKTVDEARKLIEQGFEYVTEMEGVRLFKKRK